MHGSSVANNHGALTSPVIALMGLTATGKSSVAIQLAQHLQCDIISVDSVMVYKGLDIGSAKPTVKERQLVRHHLIDCVDAQTHYSVAQFVNQATQCINDNQVQQKPTLLVGGSMLYFNALLNGLSELPSTPESVRLALNEQLKTQGVQALHQQLKQVDPISADRLHPNDAQRIMRAIAIWQVSGQPMSQWQDAVKIFRKPDKIIALTTNDRDKHRAIIRQRFFNMLEAGFDEEVEKLYQNPNLSLENTAIRSVGYRQWWDYLNQTITRDQAIELAITATHQLAKKQRTWFKKFPTATLIEVDQLTTSQMFDQLLQHLNLKSS